MGPDGNLATKSALRTWARRRRASLDVAALSALLSGRIASLQEYRGARSVLIYLAMPGEIDVEGLLDIEAESRTFLVPRCAPGRRLALHRYAPGQTALRAGPFGIREPDPARTDEADPAAVDLVIVPTLMLSEAGDRLGYGGGYYDRLLPRLRAACVRVSAVPETLLVPHLPHDPWDATIDVIVTEERIVHPVTERCRTPDRDAVS